MNTLRVELGEINSVWDQYAAHMGHMRKPYIESGPIKLVPDQESVN